MDNEKLVSPYISAQFPFHYRENYPQLVEFVKTYYSWLEQKDQAIGHARRLQEYRDIDEVPEEYIAYFKNKYLPYIKFITEVDKRTLVKHAQDLYRSKGTERGVDLFFKLVYGVPADVYYPATDLFRLSDNTWVKRKYLEVGHLEMIGEFIGKKIIGTRSGATAFAEKFIQKKVGNKYINVLFISNIVGDFIYNEKLAYDGITDSEKKRPKVIGSLTALDITTGSKDFAIGDVVKVYSNNGYGALGRVSSVYNTSGLVDFTLVDGGWGYTQKVEGDTYLTGPKVYVSEKIMALKDVVVDQVPNNPDEAPYVASAYFTLEKVYQPLANLNYKFDTSLQEITVVKPASDWYSVGATLYQVNSSASNIAVGVVVTNSSINSTAQNLVIRTSLSDQNLHDFYVTGTGVSNITVSGTPTINSAVLSGNIATNIYSIGTGTVLTSYASNGSVISTVQIVNNDIFDITAKTANIFVYVISGNTQTNTYFWSPSNTYSINVSAVIDKTATGNVVGFGNTLTLYINDSTAIFTPGQYLTQRRVYPGGYDISAKALIQDLEGAIGNYTVLVSNSVGVFSKGHPLYMQYANGAESGQTANLISYDGYIGVANIHNDFVATGNNKIYTRGWTRDSNNKLIIYGSNSVANMVSMSTGKGARFETSNTLAYAESYSIYTDFIAGNNEFEQPYIDLHIANSAAYSNALTLTFSAGANTLEVSKFGAGVNGYFTTGSNAVSNTVTSGFGTGDIISVYLQDGSHYITSVSTITNSSYMNLASQATFTGNSLIYRAGASTIDFNATNWIVCGQGISDFSDIIDANSTHITISQNTWSDSSGVYYLVPSDGIEWGFPKLTSGTMQYIMDDVLSSLNGYVGEITKLVAINPGEDYNLPPMVIVREPFTAGFHKKDYILTCNNLSGSFTLGEVIAQNNGARGLIKSIENVVNGDRILYVRRQNLPMGSSNTYFTTQFTLNGVIQGDYSNVTATIIGIQEDETDRGIGLNAVVTSNVVIGNGIVGGLDILSSGFGFENNENATFISEDGMRVGTAKVRLINQGVTDGTFEDESSFLSSSKYLFDGDYYQEYSYDIKTSIPRTSYLDNYTTTMHLSGTKMFSTYVHSSENSLNVTVTVPEGANLIANTF